MVGTHLPDALPQPEWRVCQIVGLGFGAAMLIPCLTWTAGRMLDNLLSWPAGVSGAAPCQGVVLKSLAVFLHLHLTPPPTRL